MKCTINNKICICHSTYCLFIVVYMYCLSVISCFHICGSNPQRFPRFAASHFMDSEQKLHGDVMGGGEISPRSHRLAIFNFSAFFMHCIFCTGRKSDKKNVSVLNCKPFNACLLINLFSLSLFSFYYYFFF